MEAQEELGNERLAYVRLQVSLSLSLSRFSLAISCLSLLLSLTVRVPPSFTLALPLCLSFSPVFLSISIPLPLCLAVREPLSFAIGCVGVKVDSSISPLRPPIPPTPAACQPASKNELITERVAFFSTLDNPFLSFPFSRKRCSYTKPTKQPAHDEGGQYWGGDASENPPPPSGWRSLSTQGAEGEISR